VRFRLIPILLLCLALAATTGCSKRHRVYIESNGCWSGNINGDQNIYDCGNATYRIVGPLHCVRVSLTSSTTAYLRVKIDDGAWVSNPDQYGIVQTCN
jgi:hypothetical protein